jgi:hypothetical protein
MAPPSKTETTELELTGFTLPNNVRLQQGESGLMIGASYSNGMNTSGLVERMTYIGAGVIRVQIGQGEKQPPRFLLIFGTGLVAEEKPQ